MAHFERDVEGNGSVSFSFVKHVFRQLDQVLFPPHCLVCGIFGEWVCRGCEQNIVWINGAKEAPLLPSGRAPIVCHYWSLTLYADKAIQGVIHALKYRVATCVELVLERWIRLFIQRNGHALPWMTDEAWALVPVPTVHSHIRERGIDHGLFLARIVARVVPSLVLATNVVSRTEETGFANAELDDERLREANTIGQWKISDCIPEQILLVDDVYTTGSTVQSLAGVLVEAGAKQVEILTLATGKR